MAGKKRKGKFTAFIIVAVILIASAVVTYFVQGGKEEIFNQTGLTQTSDPDKMYVHFIDVNQGDSAVIICNGTTILVDGGEYAELQNVAYYLKNLNIKKLDLVIATHPHTDHIGSLGTLLRMFKLGDIIMPDIPESIIPTSTAYEKMLKSASLAENVIAAKAGETYTYGELTVQILGPVKDYDDLNNESVVAKISYGDTSVMMCGDAEIQAEADMLKNKYDFSAELLKTGHHGSSDSSSDEWLKAVKPKYAVISCGENNEYGHPHKATVKRFDKYRIQYFRTDLLGDIVFVSDGKEFSRVIKN